MNLRDKFHALCKTRGLDASGHIGDWSSDFEYDHSHTQIMWEGFQAGAASRDAEVAEHIEEITALKEVIKHGDTQRERDMELAGEERDQLRVQINKLREALGKHVTELMNIAVSNGANSVSMPDDYVATAWLLSETPEQSLTEYRNKVIEECAVAAEQVSPNHIDCGMKLARAIRARKEQGDRDAD